MGDAGNGRQLQSVGLHSRWRQPTLVTLVSGPAHAGSKKPAAWLRQFFLRVHFFSEKFEWLHPAAKSVFL
jgi:hypothetical protein